MKSDRKGLQMELEHEAKLFNCTVIIYERRATTLEIHLYKGFEEEIDTGNKRDKIAKL